MKEKFRTGNNKADRICRISRKLTDFSEYLSLIISAKYKYII